MPESRLAAVVAVQIDHDMRLQLDAAAAPVPIVVPGRDAIERLSARRVGRLLAQQCLLPGDAAGCVV